MAFVFPGFESRRRAAEAGRLPPGQYDVGGSFPALSPGPVPNTGIDDWDVSMQGDVGELRRWTSAKFRGLHQRRRVNAVGRPARQAAGRGSRAEDRR